MASLIFAAGYAIHQAVMDHKEKKKEKNKGLLTSDDRQKTPKGETLREKATRKLHGSNPSQLGDPISMKAETSEKPPMDEEAGARSSVDSGTSTLVEGKESQSGKGRTLREKAAGTNPSLLGDPISAKAETSDRRGEGEDAGNPSSKSKL